MKNLLSVQDLAKEVIDLGEKASKEYVNRHHEKTYSSETSRTMQYNCQIRERLNALTEQQLEALAQAVQAEFTTCEVDSARYYGCGKVLGYIRHILKPEKTIWSK